MFTHEMTSAMYGKLYLLGKITAGAILPAIPEEVWYYQAVEDRNARLEEVRSQVRIPNDQMVDDLMIEKCQHGDILLFDRRCHKCCAGPATAFSCIVGKDILCNDRNRGRTSLKGLDNESFEHIVTSYLISISCITIPDPNKSSAESESQIQNYSSGHAMLGLIGE